MEEIDHSTARTTGGQKKLSGWDCLMLYAGMLGTCLLLWWMGGGFPPPAWSHLARLLHEPALSQLQFIRIIAQAGFLLAAWGLLCILTLRLTSHCLRRLSTTHSQQHPTRQHIAGLKQRQAAIKTQAPPLQHIQPDTSSTSVLPNVLRASKKSLAYKDHGQDPSQPLQVEDFPQPFPIWPMPPAIFGEALQVSVASCSDEGTQQVPPTKAYLLTEISGKNDTAHSLPMYVFALVDRIPFDEPGYTTSCRAIESMRDMVMHACMDMHHVSEEALAALFAEQVQKVMRVIRQQSQSDEALPAIAAILIIGSTMFVEKIGDARVYLCHAHEGFSQLTQALQVVHPQKAGSYSASSDSSQQTRSKRNERGSGRSNASTDDPKAVSLVSGDSILLCSDGVWSVLHASYLEHIIRSTNPDPADICAALLQATRKSGSTDPVSIIAVHCQEAKALLA
jgi:serine/threonine protein phosphatase PrpC